MESATPESVYSELIRVDIITETDDGVGITDDYSERWRQLATRCKSTVDQGQSTSSAPVFADHERALQSYDLDLTDEEIKAAASALTRVIDSQPNSEEAEPLLPIDADDLDRFIQSGHSALVLVSKKECSPCERMRLNLEGLIIENSIPENVVVAELNEPDDPARLVKRYDIAGAPTLLFVRDGRIDMRHTGESHHKQIITDIDRVY